MLNVGSWSRPAIQLVDLIARKLKSKAASPAAVVREQELGAHSRRPTF